ncbi:MAG TPA: coproporphyrinogen III oxidase family protein [Dehalococcoidales bacterium]|nr:coproporphyrinogen III oxidase family protein [Dehalococcoidales bacterium]
MEASGGAVALYVHVPFCRKLCPFCCFNRYLFKEDLARRYFIDLRHELELYLERGFNFSSVYFGGGTPTVLMDELGAFVTYLKTRCDIKKISLETTPGELTTQNIELLKQMGVNRLSVGVQSFDESVLKTMGRNNGSAEEVKKRLLAAEGQFATLNVDFVFNFPGQTVAQFASDVAAFKSLGLDQATFYPLMASPHKKDAMERRFNRVNNSRERLFYDIILRELYQGGYKPSTAWCFSRGERMIDEYIVEDDDYIGIGAGSVSMFRGNFLVNTFSLDRYHAFAEENKLPLVGWRRLSTREARRYYLLTKLFGLKVDTETLNRRFEGDAKLGFELAFLKIAGVISGGGVLNVTERGMHPVSVMMREFFASLNTLREQYIERQI